MSAGLIGVVNAGSSSLKFSLYDGERRLLDGQVDGIGATPGFRARDGTGLSLPGPDLARTPPRDPADALEVILPWLRAQLGGRGLAALGHRVVHGGPEHDGPARVTPALLAALERLCPLAPLHQPHNLKPIRRALELAPGLPQVACFDTAFHRTMPEVAQAFALPFDLLQEGVRRYGFHGLSYAYIASVLTDFAPEIAQGRVIVAHLGNGAPLCALRGGRSQATTMGFSALDGLPMGTRCGDLDPGVVLHLLREKGMSADAVEAMLYRRSGMLGLSGISPDFRDLLGSGAPRARFALDVFIHRTVRSIGALAAVLGGLDGLVFTAGVGENAAPVRAAICAGCAWLDLDLDPQANTAHGPLISSRGSRVRAYVCPTDENLMIARDTARLLSAMEA